MMNRKKLTNKEKFVFNEAEIVPPLGKGVLSKRPSAQKRLCPKAETNKPAFNPPIPSPGSSPFTPVRTTRGGWMRPRGDYKGCTTTDPCVEEVVAKLAKFNFESPSTNLTKIAPKSLSKEVFDPFESYHKRTYSTQNPNKPGGVLANSGDERKSSAPSWKTAAMFKPPRSPLTPPTSPDHEFMKVKMNIEGKKDTCICMRPLKLILCPVCSHTLTGRLRKTCQVHPAELYLLDIEACPSCKETKFVLKEYELPDGFIPVVNNLVNKN